MPLIQPWAVPPLRGAVRSLCLGLAMGGVLAVGAPAPATLAQEAAATQEVTVELTPEAARIAALQALHSDRLDAARRLSLALLQRNPDDMTALMIMAVAGAKTGHTKLATIAGKRAYSRAESRDQKFEAALLTAAALDRAGKAQLTKFWLRRATETAPTETHRQLALRNFRSVQRKTALSYRLDLGIGPSNNVNDGSRTDVMWLMGLPYAISDALPGGVWHSGLGMDYRLSESAKSKTTMALDYRHDGVWLNATAQARQPSATSSQFARDMLRLGVTHQWRPKGDQPLSFELGTTMGQGWTAGRQSYRDTGLRARINWQPRADLLVTGDLAAATSLNLLDSRRNAQTYQLGLRLTRAAPSGGTQRMGVELAAITSAAADLHNNSLSLSMGWQPGAAPFGITTDFSLKAEVRDYSKITWVRPDVGVTAAAEATFQKLDYLGFVPQIRLEASRNKSGFAPRDRSEIKTGIGIVSKF